MKIILIDYKPDMMDNLKLYMEQELRHDVVEVVSSTDDFRYTDKYLEADIILITHRLIQNSNSQAIRNLIKLSAIIHIMVLAFKSEEIDKIELMGLGCRGVIYHENIYEKLAQALEAIKEGDLFYPITSDYYEITKKYNINPQIIPYF